MHLFLFSFFIPYLTIPRRILQYYKADVSTEGKYNIYNCPPKAISSLETGKYCFWKLRDIRRGSICLFDEKNSLSIVNKTKKYRKAIKIRVYRRRVYPDFIIGCLLNLKPDRN